MTESAIIKAIEEAYKNAEKAGPVQYSWQDGVEHARQFLKVFETIEQCNSDLTIQQIR